MAQFAVDKARSEAGDRSGFDITATWHDGNVQVDFRPKHPGREGRRYLVGFIGEILSAQPLPYPYTALEPFRRTEPEQ